ncbi:hypothetical protein Cni_G05181 [Canna indica]|uniref:DYW domain-containing protein n=1 Tax=Canna indica TaxID=4628 RepID=A0AAQ3Q579_9LILI|nr:hypothetical protein Cni_G05181 [Canna indica]
MSKHKCFAFSLFAPHRAKKSFFSSCSAAAAAIDSFLYAVDSPVPLDPRSFVSALVRCRSPAEIKPVHALASTTGAMHNLGVANKHMYIYAQHGALADAYALFSRMGARDNVSWSVIIGGFSKVGDYDNCFRIFGDFVRSGSRIDNFTLPFVLRACRDTMSLRLGIEIHHLVFKAGLQSDLFVSAALVDMYARCGDVENARKVFDKMSKRDMVTWTVMISGYAECGNPEESLALFDRMMEEGVVPDKIATVTVAFACSKLGGLRKTPGWTWIEINGKTHRFRVCDKSHPQSREIYEALKMLIEKLELVGYVPDTNFVLHDVDEELKAGFLYTHSEKLAISYGLIATPDGSVLRITKNLRVCGDCHTFTKLTSAAMQREIIVRDGNRFHHFKEGSCSCGDYW